MGIKSYRLNTDALKPKVRKLKNSTLFTALAAGVFAAPSYFYDPDGFDVQDYLDVFHNAANAQVRERTRLVERCSAYESNFNTLLEENGAEGRIIARYDHDNGKYGNCRISVSYPGQWGDYVGSFNHDWYRQPRGESLFTDIKNRYSFNNMVIRAFNIDDMRIIGQFPSLDF